jgi:hypothetical protein
MDRPSTFSPPGGEIDRRVDGGRHVVAAAKDPLEDARVLAEPGQTGLGVVRRTQKAGVCRAFSDAGGGTRTPTRGDSGWIWLSHREFRADWTRRWTQPHLQPHGIPRVRLSLAPTHCAASGALWSASPSTAATAAAVAGISRRAVHVCWRPVRRGFHGKEGVAGSSPAEGFRESPAQRGFLRLESVVGARLAAQRTT